MMVLGFEFFRATGIIFWWSLLLQNYYRTLSRITKCFYSAKWKDLSCPKVPNVGLSVGINQGRLSTGCLVASGLSSVVQDSDLGDWWWYIPTTTWHWYRGPILPLLLTSDLSAVISLSEHTTSGRLVAVDLGFSVGNELSDLKKLV